LNYDSDTAASQKFSLSSSFPFYFHFSFHSRFSLSSSCVLHILRPAKTSLFPKNKANFIMALKGVRKYQGDKTLISITAVETNLIA